MSAATMTDGAARGGWRTARTLALLACLALVGALATGGTAHAAFGIVPGSFEADAHRADGSLETGAAVHPASASTSFRLWALDAGGAVVDPGDPAATLAETDGNARTVVADLPAGFLGNPQAAPKCARAVFATMVARGVPTCPTASQVGVLRLLSTAGGGSLWSAYPVYNLEPKRGDVADFGMPIPPAGVHAVASVRSGGDYGVTVRFDGISTSAPFAVSSFELWGVPADQSHDDERGWLPGFEGAYSCAFAKILTIPCANTSSSPPRPFLTNPSVCDGKPLVTRLTIDSWQAPGAFQTAEAPTQDVIQHCDELSFEPSVSISADTTAASAPAGVTVKLRVPQHEDNPAARATPPLRRAVVTLPEGMTINPAVATGLQGCDDARFGLHEDRAPDCPAASAVGEATVVSPLVDEPLSGRVYVGSQRSGDPASGEMYRLFVTLELPERGLRIKLVGHVRPDPSTGRVETSFDDNPQLPFSELTVRLDGGPRAVLSNPPACGAATASARLTPWSSADAVMVESSFAVTADGNGAPCGARGFAPRFVAGTLDPRAGASAPFALGFSRGDRDEELSGLTAELPRGLLARIARRTLCADALAAIGTCGEASRVGAVTTASGAGPSPLTLAGRVFLTGPYRGAPFGLSIVVPAVAGPFDLGTVVVRAAIRVDPRDAHVTVVSDPLPRILAGVPLQIRLVDVRVDEPGFMVNPTSCAPSTVRGTLSSTTGRSVAMRTRFQVGDCRALALAPVVQVDAGGKGETRRFRHPRLRVRIRQSGGQAHLDKANVVLPKAFNVDVNSPALKAACPRLVYAQDRCSKVATVGTVRAVTPIFKEPLTGPAFLLQKKGELPDIVMRLQNVHYRIDLIGVLDFLSDGRVITRVKGIPDAPITSFELQIKGGKGGSLLTRDDLCARKAATQATFRGQNGKVAVRTPTTRISGCAARAAQRRANGGRS